VFLAQATPDWGQAMSDPKEQQKTGDDQVEEDLTVPEEQAEDVRGGVSLNYGSTQVTYTPQKHD
jgi:hypothetical protein